MNSFVINGSTQRKCCDRWEERSVSFSPRQRSPFSQPLRDLEDRQLVTESRLLNGRACFWGMFWIQPDVNEIVKQDLHKAGPGCCGGACQLIHLMPRGDLEHVSSAHFPALSPTPWWFPWSSTATGMGLEFASLYCSIRLQERIQTWKCLNKQWKPQLSAVCHEGQ